MRQPLLQLQLKYEQDVVYARQRARLIAESLGFDRNDQTRISTAVSEIARNAFQYAGGGSIEFFIEGSAPPQALLVKVRDQGPGIPDTAAVLDGRYLSRTGMGVGLSGTRRLMDHFHLESAVGQGTTVLLGKTLPPTAPVADGAALRRIAGVLARTRVESPLEEVRRQNQELLQALAELRQQREELLRLNQELQDTNRGMLALYAELDEKAGQLGRANELKTRFLSNMSHEFRTPLNAILALSRLLLDRTDGDLSEEQAREVTFIRTSAEELSALVNDLLDLAKIEAGKVVVQPRECAVDVIFSGLRGMLKPMLVNEALSLVVEEPDGIPPLYTDDGKISQILRNFLSNALKFTERGEIRLSAQLVEGESRVRFAVADTGVGIAPEDQLRIFEPYEQVDTAQRGRPKGTGLGLPICRELATLLGGRVWVESTPGLGSTFFAEIPVRYQAAGIPESHVACAADSALTQVLVVEDDLATRHLYEKYLRHSGYQLHMAASLAEAREILERIAPAAILLDILMTTGDTWGFLAELKAAERTRSIPVLVLSVVKEQRKAFTLGADDYCVKPVDRRWLLDRLAALSRGQSVDRVLVIDDDDIARYILKGHLAETRYTVIEAADGPSGLRLAETERPSAIFLDLLMPGMSGFEVLQRLKQNPATQEIPVIILTSRVLEEAERAQLNEHAVAVLSKTAVSREAAIEDLMHALRQAAPSRRDEGHPSTE